MKKIIIVCILAIVWFSVNTSFANASHLIISPTAGQESTANILSRFKYHYVFEPLAGGIPRVVEVELPAGINYSDSDFAVVEDETTSLQPFTIVQTQVYPGYRIEDLSGGSEISEDNLKDLNPDTYKEFPLSSSVSDGQVLRFIFDRPITTGWLYLQTAPFSESPTRVSLKIADEGREEVVIADRPFAGDIRFTNKTASIWEVTLTHNQPLRIAEAYFVDVNQNQNSSSSIRFLMRPGSPYILFSDPQGYVQMPYLESGNLFTAQDVLSLSLPQRESNPLYRVPDDDNDGIADTTDNCRNLANPDQVDENKNGIGDACEDFDRDGVMNAVDNCPDHPNRSQQDADGDGVGDHCDSEESRLIERLSFLPWVGIVIGFGVVIGLFAVTVKKSESAIVTKPKDKKAS